MRVVSADHPLIHHKLTILREAGTPRSQFATLVEEIAMLLGVEALRALPLTTRAIETPIERFDAPLLAEPLPMLVPILRAGLGMLPGVQQLLPNAEVGFLGLKRDETTHEPTTYATRIATDLTGRHCIILDPMLATGGSMNVAIDLLFERGATAVSVLCIVASPPGIETVTQANLNRDVTVHVASIDRELTADAYIAPGLGDAGDRLFGTTD